MSSDNFIADATGPNSDRHHGEASEPTAMNRPPEAPYNESSVSNIAVSQPISNMHNQSDAAAHILLNNRYQVKSLLGDGGFGQTFLVVDTHMPSRRQCVLKQLKPVKDEPELHQMVQDRFQREAATLEKLGEAHDQIPGLYAYFSEGDQFYLVEEWVEGLTLTQKIHQDGPLAEATVQAILSKLLPAIAYVHEQKIVHRDIKPDNIILRQKDNMPVLIDFGAVKETMNTLINSGSQSSHSIVVGTPGYMPSEQLSGRPIYASDIYSIGMTAIFLLTGKIPQEMDIDPHTGALNWREHAPNVTTGFANFLDCAAHVTPQSRFATIPAMQSVLNTLMMGQLVSQVSETEMPSGPLTQPPGSLVNSGGNRSADQPSTDTQTVISSAPMPVTTAVSATGQTTVVSPAVSPAAEDVSTASQSFEATDPAPSSSQWKSAVIIGGMVGVSVLVGAMVMSGRLSVRTAADSVGEPAQVEPVDVQEVTDEAGEASAPSDQPAAETADTTAPTVPTVPDTPATPAPIASAPNANGTVVGGGSKNVRAGAGIGYSVVASVQPGHRIQVVNRENDSDGYPWYQIVTPAGARGWIAGQLIQIDGDAKPPARSQPTPTPAPTPTPRPTTPVDRTNATIVSQESGSKNIRTGPGTSYPIQHEAYPGDRVIILTSSKDAGGYTWYKVSFPRSGAQGWIAGQLIKLD